MASFAGKSLAEALELLNTVERTPGVRPLIALTLQVERWLAPDRSIPLYGGTYESSGYPLGEGAAGTGELWLLTGGRLLERVGENDVEPPTVTEISDDLLPRAVLVERLRAAVIGAYLDSLRIESLAGQELQVAVAEVISIASRNDGPSRALLLGALRDSMRVDEDWGTVAVRLRSAFEHALGDRTERVRELAARSIVDMAAIGPRPPSEIVTPERMLEVPFRSRDPVVVRAALDELLGLPDLAFEEVRAAADEHARAELASADPDVRRIAGALGLRLIGGSMDAATVAVDRSLAESAGSVARANGFRALADDLEALTPRFPQVIEALSDRSPLVREAALLCARAIADGSDQPIRLRVVTTLLESSDPTMVAAGLHLLGRPPTTLGDAVRRALEGALDGPEATRIDVVNRLADECIDAEVEEAAETYGLLLRHSDRTVRAQVLRRLAADARDRATLRDLLTHDLVEHLHDPVPELRVTTARTILSMGYPNAHALITQLAADPDAGVRNGALTILESGGDTGALGQAEATALNVKRLIDLASRGDGDARIAWSAALEHLAERRDPRRIALFISVLRSIPPETNDDFLRFAIGELDTVLLEAATDPSSRMGGALGVARRFLEPPTEPRHAARLAGAAAKADPVAFDLLWTMFTRTSGLGSEAARRELAALARVQQSPEVRMAIEDVLQDETDAARRDVLRTLLGKGRGNH